MKGRKILCDICEMQGNGHFYVTFGRRVVGAVFLVVEIGTISQK